MILKALMEYETVENNLTRQGVVRRLRVSHGTLHRYCLPWLTDCHQALDYYAKLASFLKYVKNFVTNSQLPSNLFVFFLK